MSDNQLHVGSDLLLSIIIPVYNAEPYLVRLFESILSQGLTSYEVLCVNDGSKDGSLSILRDYEARYPEVFHVFDTPNGGVSRARNIGLENARGAYIAFADADDYYLDGALVPALEVARQQGADLTVFGYRVENVDGRQNDLILPSKSYGVGDILEFMYDAQTKTTPIFYGAPWNKIYKASVAKKVEYVLGVVRRQDLLYNLHLMACCESIYVSESAFYCWALNANSATHKFFDPDFLFDNIIAVNNAESAIVSRVEQADPSERNAEIKRKFMESRCTKSRVGWISNNFILLYHYYKGPDKYAQLCRFLARANEFFGEEEWRKYIRKRTPRNPGEFIWWFIYTMIRILVPYPRLLHLFMSFEAAIRKVVYKK